MEPNESRSLDFKKRIKQSFAPHLLNPSNSKEQNDAPHPSNPTNIGEQSDTCHNIVNPKYKSVGNIPFLSDPEKSENVQNMIISSIMAKSAHIDAVSESFIGSLGHYPDSESQDGEVNNSENPVGTNEEIANIIAADAEKLGKSLKKLKIKKKKKYSNLAESNRKAPDWNLSIKEVLEPNSVSESPLKTPEEVVNKGAYLSHPELLESEETHPWTFHRLSKDDCQPSENLEEVSSQSSYEKSKKTTPYTNEEKEVIKVLRAARTFKPLKKTNLNDFDGAGVNCFKDTKIKPSIKNEKPKNVPPPGGFVCIKPLTLEDIMKRPRNIIVDECWDYDDEEW